MLNEPFTHSDADTYIYIYIYNMWAAVVSLKPKYRPEHIRIPIVGILKYMGLRVLPVIIRPFDN